MRRLHRLAFRAPPHGGACLAGWTAPAGGSDSWPLFGVRLSADSRSGPLSDPSGACRRCTKASPWVALWPAPQGRAPNSEAAHRPSVPASMRAGGRPSRRVCGPSHRSSPAESLARKLAESWQSRPCRGGDRGACGVVPARPPRQFGADAEPPRDPSESFPGHRSTRLVRSDSDLRVGYQGRSEACRGSHCARGCSIGASRDLRWLRIGEASGAVNRTSPFTPAY